MTGIILAGLFGAIMALFIIGIIAAFIISAIGVLLSFLAHVVFIFFFGVLATIGIVVLWILLKWAWRDGRELRVFFKKNKEIENRMKRQAMHK